MTIFILAVLAAIFMFYIGWRVGRLDVPIAEADRDALQERWIDMSPSELVEAGLLREHFCLRYDPCNRNQTFVPWDIEEERRKLRKLGSRLMRL